MNSIKRASDALGANSIIHQIMSSAVDRLKHVIERKAGASYRTLAIRCMYGPSRKARSAQRRIGEASRQALREVHE